MLISHALFFWLITVLGVRAPSALAVEGAGPWHPWLYWPSAVLTVTILHTTWQIKAPGGKNKGQIQVQLSQFLEPSLHAGEPFCSPLLFSWLQSPLPSFIFVASALRVERVAVSTGGSVRPFSSYIVSHEWHTAKPRVGDCVRYCLPAPSIPESEMCPGDCHPGQSGVQSEFEVGLHNLENVPKSKEGLR